MGCLEKACAFPVVKDNLCAIHLRDLEVSNRPYGLDQPALPEFAKPISLPPPQIEPRTISNMSNRLDPVKEQEVINAVKTGLNIAAVAEQVGVSKMTVVRVIGDLGYKAPKNCKCGREYGHRGVCRGVDSRAMDKEDLPIKRKENGNGRGSSTTVAVSGSVAELRARLVKQREELDEKIAACDTVIRLQTELL
jgi:hypothetical protein